jgi:hypothetical protein
MKTFPIVRNPLGLLPQCEQDRTTLEAMVERYLGALQRGILTPEEALGNLTKDYAAYSERHPNHA